MYLFSKRRPQVKLVFNYFITFANPLAGKQVNKQIVLPLFLNESK